MAENKSLKKSEVSDTHPYARRTPHFKKEVSLNKQGYFRCIPCQETFVTFCKLEQHKRIEHKPDVTLICSSCNELFQTKDSYLHHKCCANSSGTADGTQIPFRKDAKNTLGIDSIEQDKYIEAVLDQVAWLEAEEDVLRQSAINAVNPGIKAESLSTQQDRKPSLEFCVVKSTRNDMLGQSLKSDRNTKDPLDIVNMHKANDQSEKHSCHFIRMLPEKILKSYVETISVKPYTLKPLQSRGSRQYVYSCNLCQATHAKYSDFIDHAKVHPLANGDSLDWYKQKKCKLCAFMCDSDEELGVHLSNAHFKQIEDTSENVSCTYKCRLCGTEENGTNTASSESTSPGTLSCSLCGDIAQTVEEFMIHKKMHAEASSCGCCDQDKQPCSMHSQDRKSTNQYECGKCDKVYLNFKLLDKHVRASHREKHAAVRCEICGLKFGTFDLLYDHQMQKHIKCRLCQDVFSSLPEAISHRTRAHLQCAFCGYSGESCETVLEHQRKCDDNDPFDIRGQPNPYLLNAFYIGSTREKGAKFILSI